MSNYLVERLRHADNVKIEMRSQIVELIGDERLTSVKIRDGDGVVTERPACGVFVMIGADPCTDWLSGIVNLDARGFVLTGQACGEAAPQPFNIFQTSAPGRLRGRRRARRLGEARRLGGRRGLGCRAGHPRAAGGAARGRDPAAGHDLKGAEPMAKPGKPEAIEIEGVPPIPAELAEQVRPYLEARNALVTGWRASDRALLILTRFAGAPQVHAVGFPMGARRQLTFEPERIAGAAASPSDDTLVVEMDVGGSEFFQLYTLQGGRLTLITDGGAATCSARSAATGGLIAYSSSRRNGVNSDLYVVDPRDPATERRVLEATGGGWAPLNFTPDSRQLLVLHYMAASKSVLYLLDLESGALTPITDEAMTVAWRYARVAADGVIWAISDLNSDVLRLGVLDPQTRAFRPVTTEPWDVETFSLSRDGQTVAYAVNEAGFSRLHVLDVASGRDRVVEGLPAGVIAAMRTAPWGDIAVTVTGARNPADAFVVDPETLEVTRWTQSETGGLDPARNAEAELVRIPSFDGESVSGFLYRPDPARFAGPRPLIINIHGGPESQSRPSFLGWTNYLINEMGVALFYPNVRGSAGFGKRYLALDDGPFLREDSIKDIGAFIDALRFRAGRRSGPHRGHRRLLRRLHDAGRAGALVGPSARRLRAGRHLQPGDLPGEHARVSPRPAARRVRRRARPGAARQATGDLAAHPRRPHRGAADGGHRRQRPARPGLRGRPGHRRGPRQRPRSLEHPRRQRGPRLRPQGKQRLHDARDDPLLATLPDRVADASASYTRSLPPPGEASARRADAVGLRRLFLKRPTTNHHKIALSSPVPGAHFLCIAARTDPHRKP